MSALSDLPPLLTKPFCTMPSSAGAADPSRATRVAILIPVFDDWASLARLLPAIDTALGTAGLRGRVTLVDDGSTLEPSVELRDQRHAALESVEILRLRCNLGHQRAIAVGLAHLSKGGADADTVVVMDGDGEDRAEDIPRLVAELSRTRSRVVFAARTKRFESPVFRVMYHVYRLLHWLLTGVSVRVGNFSALSVSALPRILISPDAWNHYAAAVFRSRMRFATLPLPRGRRHLGQSHMRFSSLAAHGLTAISVFGEIVGARLMILLCGALGAVSVLLVAVVLVKLFTERAIPGWATSAAGLLVLFAMQAILSLLVLALIVLGNRSQAKVIPLRDAEMYVDSVEQLTGRR